MCFETVVGIFQILLGLPTRPKQIVHHLGLGSVYIDEIGEEKPVVWLENVMG